MRSKPFFILIALLVLGLGTWFFKALSASDPQDSSPSDEDQSPGPRGNSSASSDSKKGTTSTPSDSRFTRQEDGSVRLHQSINASRDLNQTSRPRDDLGVVDRLFADYRLIFKENPVGTDNHEFTAVLLGDNHKKIVFIDPAHASLSRTDPPELLDRWGTPYRFHPLSGTKLDIISHGPDREPWTDDDLNLIDQEREPDSSE